ncbi:hypothetical protein [Legionella fallonii]|uniref:Uncharacterized protein n=1 Tax=Legionella fallonii LLAP-10 TaxID=1212491 RepID=A0A098GBP7_9GAMM|nr:hypothetical protein [Legionella fallonii]CEG58906.1 protein of unknown function [Legionella fallonii LLAP-10]
MFSFFPSQPSQTMASTAKEVGKFALGVMTIATAYLALEYSAANDDEIAETSQEEGSSSFLDCLVEMLTEFGEGNNHRYNEGREELLRTLP